MHEYYFKIRKGNLEFECSTTDKKTFEQQLSDWINGLINKDSTALPSNIEKNEVSEDGTSNIERSGFIDVKNLTSINEIQTPSADLAANFNLGIETPVEKTVPNANFEDALTESIQNPKTEVVEKVDTLSEFEEHLKSYNPQSAVDYLITTAMFIINIENHERFSIKQLNAKLVPLLLKPIDHGVIKEAVEQNFIRVIPDLTGTCEFTEYTLTEEGEGYFVE